jgi:hypothetical protein
MPHDANTTARLVRVLCVISVRRADLITHPQVENWSGKLIQFALVLWVLRDRELNEV